MRNHMLRAAVFFAVLLILLAAASYVLQPKNNTETAGIHDPDANGILAEPENTIDVLFLGDSEAYCAFAPLEIWQEQGITSYVCSTTDQKMYQTEEFLRSAFRNQSPKIVILETHILYRDYGRTDAISQKAEQLLPVFRYHNRWKSLRAKDWYAPVQYTGIRRDKGFHLVRTVAAADTTGYMEPSEDTAPIPSKNITHVKNILSFCRERGATLVLVSSPSTLNWNSMRHNSVSALAEELGISYLDLNLMPREVPIDWERDTLDHGDHMNFIGAQKVSRYLGRRLSETGLFEDKRPLEAYAPWNRMLEDYLEDVANIPQAQATDPGPGS